MSTCANCFTKINYDEDGGHIYFDGSVLCPDCEGAKMVEEVFDKAVDNNLIDEIVEERNFIVNTLRQFIETDEIWEQLVDNKEARKLFINNLQVLFMQETENSILIELATTKQKD